MIGTTRSRVSSFMNKFRKLGFISYNGKVEVHRSLLHAVLQEGTRIDCGAIHRDCFIKGGSWIIGDRSVRFGSGDLAPNSG